MPARILKRLRKFFFGPPPEDKALIDKMHEFLVRTYGKDFTAADVDTEIKQILTEGKTQ